jgi:hypothetical protein
MPALRPHRRPEEAPVERRASAALPSKSRPGCGRYGFKLIRDQGERRDARGAGTLGEVGLVLVRAKFDVSLDFFMATHSGWPCLRRVDWKQPPRGRALVHGGATGSLAAFQGRAARLNNAALPRSGSGLWNGPAAKTFPNRSFGPLEAP